MKAEIIASGREILSGDILDTNTNFITRALTELGMEVVFHHVVGDNEDHLSILLDHASQRSDIVVVTGGLGPTEDDRTRFAAAKVLECSLVKNEEALQTVKNFFINRRLEMSVENEVQALLPETALSIDNIYGTAPGFCFNLNKAKVYCFPGVPFELKYLVNNFLVDDIKKELNLHEHYMSQKLTVFGLPESKVGSLLADFSHHFKSDDNIVADLGTQAVIPHIFVKLYARGNNEKILAEKMKLMEEYVLKRLGDNIISLTGETLPEKAGRLLLENKKTLSVAESCTGGLIGNLLTNISGSSGFFNLSAVTYSNEAKMNVLGVKESTLKSFGAVSEQTAMELAKGARIKGNSDLGLSTTGIAGPTGAVPGKNVGMVCIGISTEKETKAFVFEKDFKDRLLNKKIFAAAALKYLINEIENLKKNFS